MKHRCLAALLAATLAAGCSEHTLPTSPALEQRVFALLRGMEPGESLTLQGAEAEVVFLAAHRLAAEYVMVPFHASDDTHARLWFSVSPEGMQPPATPAAAGAAVAASVTRPMQHTPHDGHSAQHRMYEDLSPHLSALVEPRLRAAQQYLAASRTAGSYRSAASVPQSRNAAGAPPPRGAPYPAAASVLPEPGDLLDFNVSVRGDPCETMDRRTGRVAAISERAILVADVDNPAGGLSQADYEHFGRLFDTLVHPVVTRYFGEPTDIDGNDRVFIVFTKAVNELGAGGFFHGRDLLPREVCPAGNAAEVFFQMVPYPDGRAPVELVRQLTPGILGHEYQHLINAGRRIWINHADRLEEPWLNEALSHLAEELLFHAASGVAPRSNITTAALDALTADARAAFVLYQSQNLRRYEAFLQNPALASPLFPPTGASRGAAWAFLRYLVDQSGRSEESLLRELVNSRSVGLENLRDVLHIEPLEWLHSWLLSVLLDDHMSVREPRLQQPSWNFRDYYTHALGSFPLRLDTIPAGEATRFNLLGGASHYIALGSTAARPGRLTTRWSIGAGAPPPDELRITVVRTR